MCFAPEGCALFRHRNFQTCSEAAVFFAHFDFEMCFRATTAYTFSSSQFPKVFRNWCALHILTWKCASRQRHNGVQFFISHLTRRLRTRRSSESTFQPSGAPKHGKNAVIRDLSAFLRPLLFSSLILPTSADSSVHIVGSLTSKFP